MKTIEAPFVIGDEVQFKGGPTFVIQELAFFSDGWHFRGGRSVWHPASDLTLIEPILEWSSKDYGSRFNAGYWDVFRNGALNFGHIFLGTFDDPKSVAEETEKLWKERAKK